MLLRDRIATRHAAGLMGPGDRRKLDDLGGGLNIRSFNSGNSGELRTSLPASSSANFVQVLRCSVGPLYAGDTIFASADAEITNNTGVAVAFGSWMILAATAGALTGTPIVQKQYYNVTPARHHGTHPRSGSLVVASDMATAYVIYLLTTYRSGGSGVTLVEQDYGRLSGLIFGG